MILTLGKIWQIILISNAIGGIIFAVLYLFLKDKFDKDYVKKNDIPIKGCYEVFITKEMHKEKELRVEDTLITVTKSIIDLKLDMGKKFDLLINLFKNNKNDN